MTKRCVKCGETKDTTFFHPYKRNLDGLNSWCKDCNREATRRYRAKNRELINAKSLVRTKAYYWANHEKVLAQVKARNAANPWPHRARATAESARRRGAQVVEVVDRRYVIERDGSRCHICGGKVMEADIHLDHLIPISEGGSHTADNLAVAHARCNMVRKDGRLPAQLLLIG